MRKPVEQLKLEGTYRKDRHSERDKAQQQLEQISNVGAIEIIIPEFLTNKVLQDRYKFHCQYLIALKLLEPQDLDLLDMSYDLLQRAVDIRKMLDALQAKNVLMENKDDILKYDQLSKMYIRYIDRYKQIASVFYVSPVARSKLILDAQQIEKNKIEKKSLMEQMLERKNA